MTTWLPNLNSIINAIITPLSDALLIVYLLGALMLALYTLGQLALLVQMLRPPRPDSPPRLHHHPPVTVQLPIYNERYVVERLLQAVANLDYPHERLFIQILDDSTDETSAIIARALHPLRARGLRIEHLRRPERTGYKAGALAYGLTRAQGDYIAIFDADFLPPPDFLQRTIAHLEQAPDVGMVQTRWGHLNASHNVLTRAQRLAVDAHFLIEQGARSRAGWLIPFNGTGGVWRRACIEDAGGWSSATLTEDFDLSYRAQLNGWRASYLPDCVVPSELPPQLASYRQQQARWAMGSTQCLRRLLIPVWRARHLSLATRIMATHHLLQYVPQLLMVGLLALTPPLLLSGRLDAVSLAGLGVVGVLPPLLIALGQWLQPHDERPLWQRLLAFPVLVMLATGTTYANGRAVWRALLGRQEPFRRTPKFAGNSHRPTHPYRLLTLPYAETIGALYALFGVVIAWHRLPHLMPYLLIYALAFGGVASWLWYDALHQLLAHYRDDKRHNRLKYEHENRHERPQPQPTRLQSLPARLEPAPAGRVVADSLPGAHSDARPRHHSDATPQRHTPAERHAVAPAPHSDAQS